MLELFFYSDAKYPGCYTKNLFLAEILRVQQLIWQKNTKTAQQCQSFTTYSMALAGCSTLSETTNRAKSSTIRPS
jgi:hypothetical protein